MWAHMCIGSVVFGMHFLGVAMPIGYYNLPAYFSTEFPEPGKVVFEGDILFKTVFSNHIVCISGSRSSSSIQQLEASLMRPEQNTVKLLYLLHLFKRTITFAFTIILCPI